HSAPPSGMTPSWKRSRSASKSMWPGALRRADCCRHAPSTRFIESVRALLPESNALLDRFSKRRTARRVVQVPARDLVDPRDEDTGIAPAHTVALLAVAHAGAKRAAVEHAGARAVLPTAPREKAGPASPAPCARRPRASG